MALHDALHPDAWRPATIAAHPVREACAAVSVGIVDGRPCWTCAYVEDAGPRST